MALHYITLHRLHYIHTVHYVHDITLQYITLHYIALHCIALHYSTLHHMTLHDITLHRYIHTYKHSYIYISHENPPNGVDPARKSPCWKSPPWLSPGSHILVATCPAPNRNPRPEWRLGWLGAYLVRFSGNIWEIHGEYMGNTPKLISVNYDRCLFRTRRIDEFTLQKPPSSTCLLVNPQVILSQSPTHVCWFKPQCLVVNMITADSISNSFLLNLHFWPGWWFQTLKI